MSLRPAALVVTLVLILVACGGAASPSASGASPSAGAASPSATAAAEPSQPEQSEPPPSVPGLDLDAAAEALAGVDSYRLRISIQGAVSTTVQAVIVRNPEAAQDITIENAQGTQHIVVIGDEAWVDAGNGTFAPVPAQAAAALTNAFDPVLLAGQVNQPGFLSAVQTVGTEDKNGVSTTHYRLDADSPGAQLASLPPGAAMDFWVAEDGYLVSLTATGIDPSLESMSIDVTNINDPANVVERPD
jgi:hypothetical protein